MSELSQTVRSEEPRSEHTAIEWPAAIESAGLRIEETAPEPVCLPTAYGNLMKLVDGRSGEGQTGTVCGPLSSSGEIPSPTQSACGGAMEAGQIQAMWNQVLAESNRQVTGQIGDQTMRSAEDKTKKLEKLLMIALSSGDMDTAILLFSGLESSESNKLAASLMNRMRQLQQQRQSLTSGLTQQSQSGDGKQDAQNAQSINAQVGDISTEINMLQTFLQDISEHKNETQQMASNFLKSRHDTAMSIIRNMA